MSETMARLIAISLWVLVGQIIYFTARRWIRSFIELRREVAALRSDLISLWKATDSLASKTSELREDLDKLWKETRFFYDLIAEEQRKKQSL